MHLTKLRWSLGWLLSLGFRGARGRPATGHPGAQGVPTTQQCLLQLKAEVCTHKSSVG